jgi:hypothetical protein
MSRRVLTPAYSFSALLVQIWLSTSSAESNADYDGDAAIQLYGSEAKTALLELPGPFKGGSVSGNVLALLPSLISPTLRYPPTGSYMAGRSRFARRDS